VLSQPPEIASAGRLHRPAGDRFTLQ